MDGKTTKNKEIPLNSSFIFGVYDYVMWTFSWINRNNRSPQSRRLKTIMKSFLADCKFKSPPCVSVFNGHRQQKLLQAGNTARAKSSAFSEYVFSLVAAERKSFLRLSRGG